MKSEGITGAGVAGGFEMRKNKNVLHPAYGLFIVNPLRRPYVFIKDVVIYVKRLCFLVRNGYSPVCQWEYPDAVMQLSKEVFTWLRNNRFTDIPFMSENERNWPGKNDELYESLLVDLECMKNYHDAFDDYDYSDILEHTNHFFDTLNKYFYQMWD